MLRGETDGYAQGMSGPLYAGVELGGTKCICILARSYDEVIDKQLVDTTEPDATVGAIEAILADWNAREPVRSLGIASFGPIDLNRASPTWGFITTTTKQLWRGTDVARRLQQALGGIPTAFDTDVNGAALAELRWGAGKSLTDLAYVTVGTGVGVGLIANGAPVHGYGHPELGHMRVARRSGDDWPGACSFHGGCVEGLASGAAIRARLNGRSFDDVSEDDPLWESVGWALAQLCHVLVVSTAPQAILMGGGVMERQPHLLARVPQLLRESLSDYLPIPPGDYVRAPGLGSMAGPLGAIALAMNAAGDA
jgi:fructokinase